MGEKYKTAEELGITEQEREALVASIDVLRQEQLVFDMGAACLKVNSGEIRVYATPCGTRACIGGTMSLLMQNGMALPSRVTKKMADEANVYVMRQSGHYYDEVNEFVPPGVLYNLFFGTTETGVTPAEGIQAIESFLAGRREDPWEHLDGSEYDR